MPRRRFLRSLPVLALVIASFSAIAQAQGARQTPQTPIPDSDADHIKERSEWFLRGRLMPGKSSAELRRRAYQAKLRMRAQQAAALAAAYVNGQSTNSPPSWAPLGPVPLASDATGSGTQDYHQVAGRATAVAIDSADPTGNTIYIGGAQGGIWKSINAASSVAGSVTWTPLTDDQATLSIGAIAIQPGSADVTKSVILAATGEADSSADSYFGLGILRSADAGNTWNLIGTANSGALSFSGLGGTRMAFSAATPNTVVAAMATTSEGMIDGAVTANTMRGLYTSTDAGQTWTYDALVDPGGATDATSATSVVYNAGANNNAGLFFTAVRYHGLYSSPDGITWTRLAAQPGGSLLGTSACPPQSTSNGQTCPIYRGELTVVPGRSEMYVWFIYLSPTGSPVDGGIWQSMDGGASWAAISDTGVTNCGDFYGCGVQQGAYNLELLAVPNCPNRQPTCSSGATDLYAGAINLYKCSIDVLNPTCAAPPFLDLTHAYGCDPISAPAHVHPDQHALAFMIPSSGSDSGNALMYFANDGGINRALDGFSFSSSNNSGSCSATDPFDDLNQNLGSMTQFVSFSQHPTDPNTLLGGTQDNGSPATSHATTSLRWGNVLGGDGGYNAIDPTAPSNFYASNPDIPPGGLGIQLCSSGVNCVDSGFSFVVTSGAVGGDDGGFYFPYILDPRTSAMVVGTCRVWRGPRSGGPFTVLSPNFDTLGSGTCTGSEVNQVRALAAAGQPDANGSGVIYATTSGLGPIDGPLSTPGGRVWVTTDASAGVSAFAEVTGNGPLGNINPNQFPISGVATDSSDITGNTAYITVMGFTGGPGHVWKTVNAGATWTDFTANLPDSPVNAVVIYPPLSQVYVGTDVGVFVGSTSSPKWTELALSLPNAAVTALGIFASGGQQLLRAATYGRGVWQFNLASAPDFQISVSNSPQTEIVGQAATFDASASALDGYASSVTLSCAAGLTAAPSTCSPVPSSLTPGIDTRFTITTGGGVNDYYFNLKAAGSDSNHASHAAAVVLHVLNNGPDFVLSEPANFPVVRSGSSTTSGPISITASGGFSGVINLTCSLVSGNGSCSVSPATVTSIPTTANVTVNATNLSASSYQLVVQGTSGPLTHTLALPFNVVIFDFQLAVIKPFSAVDAGSVPTAIVSVTSNYRGAINASCDSSAIAATSCTVGPSSTSITANVATTLTISVNNMPANTLPNTYSINLTVADSSGQPRHTLQLPLTVQDFSVTSATSSQTVSPGQTIGAYQLIVGPNPAGSSFAGAVTLSCGVLPAGAQCLFNPSTPQTPGSSAANVVMSISTSAATAVGTYPVIVTGTSGSLSHSTSVSLNVTVSTTSGDFQLAIRQPFPPAIDAGSAQTAKVSIAPSYTGRFNARCDASAISGQCQVTPANPIAISTNTSATLTLTLNVPNSIVPGQYNINVTVTDSSAQTSHSLQLPLTVIQDFSVTSATQSQTVSPGQTTGAYQLTVAPNPPGSSFPAPVTLACPTGLPPGAKCLFNPSTPQTPGNSAVNVVMTISTSSGSASSRPASSPMYYAAWLLLPGVLIGRSALGRSSRRRASLWGSIAMLLLLAFLLSCGGAGSNSQTAPPNTPTVYPITVTGTAGSLSHSMSVNLVLE